MPAEGVIPRVVTMNRAHTSHFTENPDPRIEYVLRGWNPEGGKAVHRLEVDDVLIRNVTTDIRSASAETAACACRTATRSSSSRWRKLCIGHVGHLHHVLDDGGSFRHRPARRGDGAGRRLHDHEPDAR